MVIDRLRKAAEGTEFEGKLFLVGGAVRDPLLGLPKGDEVDIMVLGDGLKAAKLLQSKLPDATDTQVFPRFGTSMFLLEGVQVELATARKESYGHESRKPETVQQASIEEDAARRDFTVNAIFQNLATGEILDPLGMGLKDIEARVLRTPRDPVDTFSEDPLRMLRGVRFAHQLGLKPAPGLYEGIKATAKRLKIISEERIRAEFYKMLVRPTAPAALQDLKDTGLLEQFWPEFVAMVGVEQGNYHHLDVWDHTMLALSQVQSDDLILRLSVLFHDVAKPLTRTKDAEGRTRFFGHESLGAEMTFKMLTRLKYSNKEASSVANLVQNHMRLGTALTLSDSALRRVVRDMGEDLPRLLDLVEADTLSLKPGIKTMDLGLIRSRLGAVQVATPRSTLVSPLSGQEIMEIAGVAAGPEVGRLKGILEEAVIEGKLAPGDKAGAEVMLRGLL